MFSLNFLVSFYFVLAIYMVAFTVNDKSFYYFLSCIASEFIGRFALFSWALTYEWGVFMHLIWAVIYCLCLMFYWLSIKKINLTVVFTIILIVFQLIMALDCKWSEGNATLLYNTYKYLIVFIHCCIVFTFIKWGSIISFMDEHVVGIRSFFSLNGYFVLYWYNVKNREIKKSIK